MKQDTVKEKIEFEELTIEEGMCIQGGRNSFFDTMKQWVYNLFDFNSSK